MLGENIKTYRQKKGYTQEEVANRLHVTRQTISKWEKNYSVPDAEVFVKLADVLEVQTSQLLEVKVDSDVQTTEEKQNAYAEQLAHIAEQMAIRNRQRKRIWKTIGIAFAVIIVVCIILIVMNIAFFSARPQRMFRHTKRLLCWKNRVTNFKLSRCCKIWNQERASCPDDFSSFGRLFQYRHFYRRQKSSDVRHQSASESEFPDCIDLRKE